MLLDTSCRVMNTSKKMQLSGKGGLVYDGGWYKDGRIHVSMTPNFNASPLNLKGHTASALSCMCAQ